MNIKIQLSILLFFLFGFSNSITAQVAKDSELFLKLKTHDSLFFEQSFNQCNLDYLKKAIHQDLTFYHDKSGIQNRTQFLEAVEKNLCGSFDKKPIRKVDAASLEVYPMYEDNILYGVVQTGVHLFYLREKNKEDVFSGKAKFIHLYLLLNDEWILKEVISFDHQ